MLPVRLLCKKEGSKFLLLHWDDSGMVPNSLPPGWCVRYPTPGDIFNNSKAASGTRDQVFSNYTSREAQAWLSLSQRCCLRFRSGALLRKKAKRRDQTRGLQRDVVYLCWPIAPWYNPNCGRMGGRGCGDSANEYSCAHHTWHGAQINFVELTPYLTYKSNYCYFLCSPLIPAQI